MLKNLFFVALFNLLTISGLNAQQTYGLPITPDGAITHNELITLMETSPEGIYAGKVLGIVTSVCQISGCWMSVSAGDSDQEEIFVQFLDYGFFMPSDLTGKKIVMLGEAYRDIDSIIEVQNPADNIGSSEEDTNNLTDTSAELRFTASGVIVLE